MSRRVRGGVGVVTVLFLITSLAYVNREAIVLKLVGFAVKRRVPVGPYQEISWSTAVDPQGRVPAERTESKEPPKAIVPSSA